MQKAYHTIISLSAGLIVLSFIFELPVLAATAGVLLFVSALSARFAAGFAAGWLSIASCIGMVLSRAALAFVFFCILTPVALLRRAVLSPSLFVLRKRSGSQYVARNHVYAPRDLENVW